MAIENPSLSQGTGEGSRGATLVKPPLRQHALAIKHKNLPVLATGFQQSQPHSIEYANPHGLVIPFALVTVASPAQATQKVPLFFRLAAPRAIQRWLSGKAHTIALLSGPQFQRLLILFTAFLFN